MKNLSLFLFVLLCMPVSVIGQQRELSQDQAWNIILNNVLNDNVQNKDVYISNTIISSQSFLYGTNNELSPNFNSWFIFIDDVPNANWAHPCRYAFVNIEDGSYVINEKMFPPDLSQMTLLTESRYVIGEKKLFDIPKRTTSDYSANHNYAIILSGGMNMNINYERYWNDCSAIYSTLVNVYNYPKDHIYVLMSDGTNPANDLCIIHDNGNAPHTYTYISSPLDLDGDNSPDIQYAATLDNVYTVFDDLKDRMTSEDELFIFTMDHGGWNTTHQAYFIGLWGNDELYDFELASVIDELNAGKINICMGQCYSGGFINALADNNRVISTACRHDQISFEMSNHTYDEFVYHWISAVTGSTPYGTTVNADSNNDGYISMAEAFTYAQTNDSQTETPQFYSNPQTLGASLLLKSSDVIYGNSSVNLSESYSLYGNPNTSVTWGCNGSGFSISSSGNQCTVTGTNTYHEATLYANIYKNGQLQKTLTKPLLSHETGLDVDGTQYEYTSLSGMYPEQTFNITASNAVNGYSSSSIAVNGDCDITLVSDRFKGMNISFEGNSSLLPTDVYCANDWVDFHLESSPTPYTLVLKAENDGGYYDFNLNFTVSPFPELYQMYYEDDSELVVNLSGNALSIFLSNAIGSELGGGLIQQSTWYLRIYRAQTGTQVYSQTIHGPSTNVYVNNYANGLYIVTAIYNGNTYHAKVYVNH
jgi:hypothetical protein